MSADWTLRRGPLLLQHLAPPADRCHPATPPTPSSCTPCAASGGGSSTVGCECGLVSFTFAVAQPRTRISCCCVDCRQKCRWAQAQGGPPLPADVVSFDAPLDLVYFPNAFRVDKGAEHVAFYRLRPDARSINLVSTCCHTTLLVDNVNYHEAKDMEADDGMQVLLFPAVIKLSTNMIDLTSASLNFATDFPPDKLAALEAALSANPPPLAPPPPPPAVPDVPEGWTTFNRLRGGRVPTVLGLVSGEEIEA